MVLIQCINEKMIDVVKNMMGRRKKKDITSNIVSDDYEPIDEDDVDMDRLRK